MRLNPLSETARLKQISENKIVEIEKIILIFLFEYKINLTKCYQESSRWTSRLACKQPAATSATDSQCRTRRFRAGTFLTWCLESRSQSSQIRCRLCTSRSDRSRRRTFECLWRPPTFSFCHRCCKGLVWTYLRILRWAWKERELSAERRWLCRCCARFGPSQRRWALDLLPPSFRYIATPRPASKSSWCASASLITPLQYTTWSAQCRSLRQHQRTPSAWSAAQLKSLPLDAGCTLSGHCSRCSRPLWILYVHRNVRLL